MSAIAPVRDSSEGFVTDEEETLNKIMKKFDFYLLRNKVTKEMLKDEKYGVLI